MQGHKTYNLMIWIVLIVLALLALRFMPVQRRYLGEGVFSVSRFESNLLTGREDRIFWFRYPCNYCWVHGRSEGDRVFTDGCPVVVPKSARHLSPDPEAGDSVVIIGYANVFGRVVLYRIAPTHFREELSSARGWSQEKNSASGRIFLRFLRVISEGMKNFPVGDTTVLNSLNFCRRKKAGGE